MSIYTFFSTSFALYVAIFMFTMRSTFTSFTFQKRKQTSKSGILEISPSPKGKDDCRNLIHFSQFHVSLYFLNLDDEFGSYITFQQVEL